RRIAPAPQSVAADPTLATDRILAAIGLTLAIDPPSCRAIGLMSARAREVLGPVEADLPPCHPLAPTSVDAPVSVPCRPLARAPSPGPGLRIACATVTAICQGWADGQAHSPIARPNNAATLSRIG